MCDYNWNNERKPVTILLTLARTMQEKLVTLTKTPPMMKTFAKSSSSGLDPAMLHTSLQDNDIMTSKVSVAAKEAQIKDFQRRIHTE